MFTFHFLWHYLPLPDKSTYTYWVIEEAVDKEQGNYLGSSVMQLVASRSVEGMWCRSRLENAHAGYSNLMLMNNGSREASDNCIGGIDFCCNEAIDRKYLPIAMVWQGGYDLHESMSWSMHASARDQSLVCSANRQNETDRQILESTDVTSTSFDIDPTCLDVSQKILRFHEPAREAKIETSVPIKCRSRWIGESDVTHGSGNHMIHAVATENNSILLQFSPRRSVVHTS